VILPLYLCRATSLTADQEHLKCSTYSLDKDACSAHFIRTIVMKEIVLSELNKLLVNVRENEEEFVQAAMNNSVQNQSLELAKSRKKLRDAEKRIAELDRLFIRLYEDNVSGKISDERFSIMSAGYEDEQKKLRATAAELADFIETAVQKSADVNAFIQVVQKYENITELTPEIMHELIEKIVVHAPDKSSGHRTQQIDIYYRFDVPYLLPLLTAENMTKRERLRNRLVTQPYLQIIKTSLRVPDIFRTAISLHILIKLQRSFLTLCELFPLCLVLCIDHFPLGFIRNISTEAGLFKKIYKTAKLNSTPLNKIFSYHFRRVSR
jgi:hypothetical protein